MMYFDIHTHILPQIDDGAKDMDCSVKMLQIAAAENENGVLFATPHFIYGTLENRADQVISACKALQQKADELDLHIRICPGNEIYLSSEIPDMLEQRELLTLNGSRYVLVEFPMMNIPLYAEEVLYQLQLKGYVPVIAHPERNKEIMRDPSKLFDFVSRGMLVQVNSGSLKGLFGNKVKEAALSLIKHNLAHFVASDAHTVHGRSAVLSNAYGYISEKFGYETAERLFYKNGLAVYNDDLIESPEPIPFKSNKMPIMNKIKPVFKILSGINDRKDKG